MLILFSEKSTADENILANQKQQRKAIENVEADIGERHTVKKHHSVKPNDIELALYSEKPQKIESDTSDISLSPRTPKRNIDHSELIRGLTETRIEEAEKQF